MIMRAEVTRALSSRHRGAETVTSMSGTKQTPGPGILMGAPDVTDFAAPAPIMMI